MEEDDETCAKDADGTAKKRKPRKKKKNKSVKEEEDDAGAEAVVPSEQVGNGDATYAQDAFFGHSAVDEPWKIPQEEWADITDLCNSAAQAMNVGEMIHSPHFRLFDAMSAIEIMDPKMDSGYNNTADMTLERAQASGIIIKHMPNEELIGIWDQLLMYYMLWLEGHTIAQTCFCCLYLHDLDGFVKPVPYFGAFVDAYLLACRRARAIILRAAVYDDEDFLPGLFNFDLEACVYSSKPAEVIDRVRRERQALAKDPSPLAAEVASRLELITEYAASLGELVAEACGSAQTSNGKKNPSEETQARLKTCLRLLEQLKAGTKERGPLPDSVLKGFDVSVNRHLLVPGPPRTVEPVMDSQVAYGTWISHVHELLLCIGVAQKPLLLLLESGITYKDEPNVLPRSIAQLRGSEAGLLRRLMVDSLTLHLFPQEALQHCKQYADIFLDHSESLFRHLLKLSHANSARRFRRLAHVFPDFHALQHEALQLDDDLKKTFGANLRHPRPCWIWIMEHCLQAMITKLLLGFELELYDEAEFHMIYWYVDYLFGLRIYNLNELQHAKEQPVGGGKKSPKRQPLNPKGSQRPRNPSPLLILLEATQTTVRGLFRLLSFCIRRELLSYPPSAMEGLAQRFVLRFRSLEHFRLPHLPSFTDFQLSAASAQAPADRLIVLEAAQTSFAEAAQALERFTSALNHPGVAATSATQDGVTADSAKALRRVIVANQLAITQLTQGVTAGKRMKVAADNTHHPHLLSIKVQTLPAEK